MTYFECHDVILLVNTSLRASNWVKDAATFFFSFIPRVILFLLKGFVLSLISFQILLLPLDKLPSCMCYCRMSCTEWFQRGPP